MKRIGIMGGTFNPIHKGHLQIARAAQKEFKLDKVVFVPTGLPPHKPKEELADKEHRYRMTRLALRGKPGLTLSKVELERKGYSYAVDTCKKLKKKYDHGSQLYYILGLDSWSEILSWKRPLELFTMCEFIVATRPRTKIKTLKRLMKFPPLAKYADKIHLMEIKIDISSSEIRHRLKSEEKITGLVPKPVEKYIQEHHLYKA